jgi:hypothetical protein
MLRPIAACLALASLSLLLPSEPSYDPWAWLVWAREIVHLELDTSGGPSWKPLPVAGLALAAPLGDDLSVALWIVLARAGALLALVLAFRLAASLAGGSAALRALAGIVAAVALALTPDLFQFAAHASEAPLAVALMLWAVERHIEGRAGQAVVLGTPVCLMRPELFPFLAVYALWLWRAEPERRGLVAALMVLVPLAWVVPEWIGSGNPLDGGSQARSEPHWSLSHADRPWLRALERLHNHTGLAVELLATAARTPRLAGAALAPATVGASRAPRLGAALALAPATVGASRARGLGAALALVALLAAPVVAGRVDGLRPEVREVGRRMELQRDLARAVDAAGGAERVLALGSATTNRALHTRLAWELGQPVEAVERGYGHRVVVRTRKELIAGRVLVWGRARERRDTARVGSFRVYRREGLSYSLFTASLQGFHIPASGGRSGGVRVVTR